MSKNRCKYVSIRFSSTHRWKYDKAFRLKVPKVAKKVDKRCLDSTIQALRGESRPQSQKSVFYDVQDLSMADMSSRSTRPAIIEHVIAHQEVELPKMGETLQRKGGRAPVHFGDRIEDGAVRATVGSVDVEHDRDLEHGRGEVA